ncbi:hypothetical protein TL18_04870 [Methanobrevibacter sp. YE315]|uniref:zinc ribbon domain-containing protein n=1 Tax=Methanobrevibacter sp. YE315 TaxID=1609968 RepID=UPI000764D2E0|nr:zinc ribbon domain-containing protein [Methanobrevibacter sp. YE315]AMD17409.1 hypothetical protein TL18_04870 [Methanobrevibacter sp. YE315]
MNCPNCNTENNDSAKFCKKCGTPLKNKTISHESMINSMSGEKANNEKNTKIIIIALVIIAVVLAGVFAYIGLANHDTSSQGSNNANSQTTSSSVSPGSSSQSSSSQAAPMTIRGGSFSTGSELSDKTYAHILIGPEHAGKSVQVQIFYSRDGSALNNGNMVPVTIDSSGYVDVASADAYRYYPDHAKINLYDSSGHLLDTQEVSLSITSGTQTF